MIEIRNFGRLEVRYTSTPLKWNVGGILSILIDDYSELLYKDGLTDLLFVDENATALLKGGQVNKIRSMQIVDDSPHITLECQSGWSWLYNTSSQIKGITGLWADDSDFTISFIDEVSSGYDPVWMNINVVIVPEPATLLLIAAGGLFLRRKN